MPKHGHPFAAVLQRGPAMFDGPLEALRESGDDARGAEVVRRQPRDGEELVAAVADEVRLPVGRVLEQVQVQGALAVRAEACATRERVSEKDARREGGSRAPRSQTYGPSGRSAVATPTLRSW